MLSRPAPLGPGGFVVCGPTCVAGAACAVLRAGLLYVPVGGGPPASRPRRELRSVRRLEARPGPATAHRHRSLALRSLRRPPHQWGLVAVWNLTPGPPGSPVLSHQWDLVGVLSRSPTRPRCPRAPPRPALAPQVLPRPSRTSLLGSPNFACNSPTTLSNLEIRSLELQRFQTLLKLRPIELHASLLGSGHVAACGCRRYFV